MVGAVAGFDNGFGRETERDGCGADGERARRVGTERPGERSAAAERVVDEPADGVAVAGAGEAMSFAPVGQRNSDGLIAVEDRFQNLDRGRDPGSGFHVRSIQVPVRILAAKTIHIANRATSADAIGHEAPINDVARRVDVGVNDTRQNEDPGQDQEQQHLPPW